MASSRTGTALWKRIRQQAIRRARRDGLTNCPDCGVTLDYHVSGMRNSAEVDHIVPHAQGGADRIDNVRVCCRRCNQSLGAKLPKQSKKRNVIAEDLPTSQNW